MEPTPQGEVRNIDLGFSPREWQKKVFQHLRRYNVLVCHRRAGKTVLAIMALIDAALCFKKQNGRFAYIGPFQKQAKETAWTYLKHYTHKIPGIKQSEHEAYVLFPNGAKIMIQGADDPDSLRGAYLDGVVLDEVAQMKPYTWGEVIRPMIADRMGWVIFMGTPKGINLLSEQFYKAQTEMDEVGSNWYAGLFTVNDTDAMLPRCEQVSQGALCKEEIEETKRDMSEAQFAQEFLCDFSAGNESSLISVREIEESCKRDIPLVAYEWAPKILGVDVARQGDDYTVIVRRQGLMCWIWGRFKIQDSMQIASKVIECARDWEENSTDGAAVDAIFIDGTGGFGSGVIDRMRQLQYKVQEVQFAGSPTDPRFANKRTEMWWDMVKWIKTGGGKIPKDAKIKTELSAPQYTHANAHNKMALEAKDKIKERIGVSPDAADALALTFATPVAKILPEERRAMVREEQKQYNPFEEFDRSIRASENSVGGGLL